MSRFGFVCIGLLIFAIPAIMFCGAVRASSGDTAEQPGNLIENPSFEKGADDGPAGWRKVTFGGNGEFKYVEGGRTGKRAVCLSSEEGADIAWLATVSVKPRSRYRLSGWIKTENVKSSGERRARGALLNLHNIQPAQTPAVTGTKDWTKVEVVFDTGARAVAEINCLFGGWGWSTGKAWYDDVQLELLSTKTTKLSVTIDAGQTGEPISKYIYGQFIEHLGRCIYGGIWAEMLEDRKFYYPITTNYDPYRAASGVSKDNPYAIVKASPWQIIGAADSVTMVKEGSFVGEHTPEVKVAVEPTGIRQNALGLVKGKSYTGYIVYAGSGDPKVQVFLVWGKDKNDRKSIFLAKPKSKYKRRATGNHCSRPGDFACGDGFSDAGGQYRRYAGRYAESAEGTERAALPLAGR
jgi:alpha-N-arabinofuranosidase